VNDSGFRVKFRSKCRRTFIRIMIADGLGLVKKAESRLRNFTAHSVQARALHLLVTVTGSDGKRFFKLLSPAAMAPGPAGVPPGGAAGTVPGRPGPRPGPLSPSLWVRLTGTSALLVPVTRPEVGAEARPLPP
jgi:hypothetical protein